MATARKAGEARRGEERGVGARRGESVATQGAPHTTLTLTTSLTHTIQSTQKIAVPVGAKKCQSHKHWSRNCWSQMLEPRYVSDMFARHASKRRDWSVATHGAPHTILTQATKQNTDKQTTQPNKRARTTTATTTTDGRTDRRTDGRTNGRMDGRTDGRTLCHSQTGHCVFAKQDIDVVF